MANVISRMSKNAGHDSATKSGKGHFAGAMQKLAKAKNAKRGNKPVLQHGNTLTKKAPMGGAAPFGSAVTGGPGLNVQASPAQAGLNEEQQ